MIKTNDYFTAGELAAYYGIQKQTLLYYDKIGVLEPAFTNENGYRFYTVKQYHTLEIILNLRKLDISLQEIKTYLSAPSAETFESLLIERLACCDAQILELNAMKANLTTSLTALRKVKKTRLNQIELAFQDEQNLLVSDPLNAGMTGQERMKLFSQHNQQAFSRKYFKEFNTGWIIERKKFFASVFNETHRYFTPIAQPPADTAYITRPEGLYLHLAFQGTYYQHIAKIFPKIQLFMRLNALIPLDDIYVLPIKSHWLTDNVDNYINEISLLVEPAEK